MLYGYFLYLNAFLDGIGAADAGNAAERASGPRGRFRRNRVLVDVASPVTGSRFPSAGLLAVFLALRELLLLLEGGTSREGGVRRRWLLRWSRTVGRLDGSPGGHR